MQTEELAAANARIAALEASLKEAQARARGLYRGNTELTSALMSMVNQNCAAEDGVVSLFSALSCDEEAVKVLVAAGFATQPDPKVQSWGLNWEKLDARMAETDGHSALAIGDSLRTAQEALTMADLFVNIYDGRALDKVAAEAKRVEAMASIAQTLALIRTLPDSMATTERPKVDVPGMRC